MTKLTTERLEKLQDDLLQFQDSYSDPADKENYDIFVDALHVIDEFKIAKEKILAYEQAAEKPYGYLEPYDFPRTTATLYPEKDRYAVMPIYAAPVLPKQPEQCEVSQKRLEVIGYGSVPASISEQRSMARALLSAQPVSNPYKSAANDIIAERQRQIIEEGWTPERDDSYSCGELAGAAACYARYTNARGWVFPTNPTDYQSAGEPLDWPWDAEWWKPSNPRRDLVKAGALILAEIERMDRIAPAQESE